MRRAEVLALGCRSLKKYWQPPYQIGNGYGALGVRTVSMGASHHNGAVQWDTHNLYGISESVATAAAVAAITQQRPFVLSRRAPRLPEALLAFFSWG